MRKTAFLLSLLLMVLAPRAFGLEALTTASLHLRNGPGIHHQIIGVMPISTPIVIFSCSSTWCQVKYDDKLGWASIDYLAFKTAKQLIKGYQAPTKGVNIWN